MIRLCDAYQNQESYARLVIIGLRKKMLVLMIYLNVAIAIQTRELIFSGTYEVPSPIASIKWHINKIIRERRKTKNYGKEI